MILKIRIKAGWVYKDEVMTVVDEGEVVTIEYKNGSRECCQVSEHQENGTEIYLMNNEGRTIEKLR